MRNVTSVPPRHRMSKIYHPPKQAEKGKKETKTSRAQLCHRAATVKTPRRRIRRRTPNRPSPQGRKHRPLPTDGFIRRNAAWSRKHRRQQTDGLARRNISRRIPVPRVLASLASSNAWELTRCPFCRNASAFLQKFGTPSVEKQNASALCFSTHENLHLRMQIRYANTAENSRPSDGFMGLPPTRRESVTVVSVLTHTDTEIYVFRRSFYEQEEEKYSHPIE